MAQLPSFKEVLLDAQRTRLSQELVAIRDGLLAPDVLLRFSPSDALNQMSKELSDSVEGQEGFETTETYKFFQYIEYYVNEAAYGEAALRFRGHAPPLAQPVKGSVTAALRASSKVDLQTIRDALGTTALEAARKGDEKSAEDVALRLQKQIQELSMQFYTITSQVFEYSDFPLNDKFINFPQEATDYLVDTMPPLDGATHREAQDSTLPPSVHLLHDYQIRGAGIRYILSLKMRATAKEAFERASKEHGEARVKSYNLASHCYEVAATYIGHADVAFSNMSAIALILKMWPHAIFHADKALYALEERLTYPSAYGAKRAAAIMRIQHFQSDDEIEPVRGPRLPRTEEQIKADNTIVWKATCRKARAYAGLSMQKLNRTQGAAISEADRKFAESLRDTAVELFQAAFKLDESDRTPLKDLEAFERERAARLAAA